MGTSPPLATTWRLSTPPERAGAIAILQLRGDVEGALVRLGIAPVAVGEMRLRNLAGVDRGVIARVKQDLALFTPHGGQEIIGQLGQVLGEAGIVHDTTPSAAARFPEARSPFEAELLDAVARAASPRAVDLLLDQPRRWASHSTPAPDLEIPAPDHAHSRQLDRLIVPPLVVAVGASNIGKSTLLNRLCGRVVAATADEPGTTRDHVGSLIDLDGLVVRYVDTPGLRDDAPASEQEAMTIARGLLSEADLVLVLGDRGTPPPQPRAGKPAPLKVQAGETAPLVIALRADLGVPEWAHDMAVSATTGSGMAELVLLLRRRLVSDEALGSPLPWRFWAEVASGSPAAGGATL